MVRIVLSTLFLLVVIGTAGYVSVTGIYDNSRSAGRSEASQEYRTHVDEQVAAETAYYTDRIKEYKDVLTKHNIPDPNDRHEAGITISGVQFESANDFTPCSIHDCRITTSTTSGR